MMRHKVKTRQDAKVLSMKSVKKINYVIRTAWVSF